MMAALPGSNSVPAVGELGFWIGIFIILKLVCPCLARARLHHTPFKRHANTSWLAWRWHEELVVKIGRFGDLFANQFTQRWRQVWPDARRE